MDRIEELIERVKAATGPDREIDGDVAEIFNPNGFKPEYVRGQAWFVTDDVDAIAKLIDRRFPQGFYSVTKAVGAAKRRRKPDGVRIPFDAYVSTDDQVGERGHHFALTEGPTAPLALLAAFLTAYAQREVQG